MCELREYKIGPMASPGRQSAACPDAAMPNRSESQRQLRTEGSRVRQHAEIVADAGQMEGFFQHLMQTMRDLGFADPRQSDRLQRRLRQLFLRARPDTDELNILRGLLSAAQGGKSMRRP